jgi:hypothetical protein
METYFTLPFKTIKIAEKHRKQIETYFGNSIQKSWVKSDLNGFMVYYILNK